MDWGTLAEWGGVAAAIGFGVAGFCTAVRADSRAKKSNELAEVANRAASNAVRQAVEANRIAELANELSKDANALAERESREKTERHKVKWDLKWDEETPTGPVLVNFGPDTAHQVSVTVIRKQLVKRGDAAVDMDALSQQPVPGLEELTKGAREVWADELRRLEAMRSRPADYDLLYFQIEISWFTRLGFHRERVVDYKALYNKSTGTGSLVWFEVKR